MGRVVRSAKGTPQPPKLDPKQELAWKAVRNFNRMLPTLTSFARALTGNNKVTVRAGKSTETDGTIIWMRPPLGLGETVRHESSLCDLRNDTLTPLCPACRRNDDVWAGLHHEMSHILLGSFQKVSEDMRKAMRDLVDDWHPADACDHGTDLHNKITGSTAYLPMFGIFSKYLWMIHQALDDSRVDSGMLNIKPGLRNQFYSTSYRAFAEGVEQSDGKMSHWRDAPVNAQVVVGMMLIASGCHIREGWLRPEVLEILDDETLQDLLADATHWGNVDGAAWRTIAAFRRLNDMGLCVVEKCVPPEPTPPSLNNDSDKEKSDDGDPQPGDDPVGDEEDASDGDDDPSGDDEESDSDGGDGSESDGSGDDDSQASPDSTDAGDEQSGDGSFGNDFENEDSSSDGSDKEGGDSDSQSEDESVPDDAGDEDGEATGGSSDQREAEPDENSDGDAGEDQADAVDSSESEDEAEDGEASPEADPQGDSGSSTSGESSNPDGNRDAQDGDGDASGESQDPADKAGYGGGGDGSFDPDESKSASQSTDDDASVDADGEEDVREDEPLGDEVWSEQYDDPRPQAVRSIPGDEFGDEDLAEEFFGKFTGHSAHDEDVDERLEEDDPYDELDDEILVVRRKAVDNAVMQAAFFDRSSVGVGEVVEYEFPTKLFGWVDRGWISRFDNFLPTEAVIGRALLKARIVFAENKRSRHVTGLTSGRVNGSSLGKRAALGDERLFKKRIAPGKRDYIVGITVDCSGSTQGNRIERIKRAVFAKAELLHRLGVKFYITAHTGGMERWWTEGYDYARDYGDELENLMILWIKKPDEPWNNATRTRLATLPALANNFDGHTLEFHRKVLERRTETDKILIYYTDGAMPAANYDEELAILTDELVKYNRAKIHKLAVGINTDSPSRYGFDTVRVDGDEDLIKVVQQLERYLV